VAGALRLAAGQHLPLHGSRPYESDTGKTLGQVDVPLLAFHEGSGLSIAFSHKKPVDG
jgi:hypothetical protein